MDPKKHKKRRADDFIDSDSDNEIRLRTHNWPRFLLVESEDDTLPLAKLSPFAIDKGFQALISGRLRSVKRLRNQTFLVECETKKQCDLLLKSHRLVDRPMKVSVHNTLNSSRGVIRCRDLAGMSENDIRDELKDQGVTHVRRVNRKVDGQIKATNTLFLTFCQSTLPKDIRIGYLKVNVEPFIPNPLRCFKCQKFGHGAQRCNSKETVCPICASVHEGKCTKPPKCVNCEGDHASSSKDCNVWKREKEIQTVKTEKKLSYPDARKAVLGTNAWSLPDANRQYASVAAKQMVSCSVQTDVTWLKSANPEWPKAPPVKTTQTGAESLKQITKQSDSKSAPQSVTQQQTPTKASSARPGRSSANVEIVESPSVQRKKIVPVRSSSASRVGTKRSPVKVPLKESDRLKKMERDPVKTYNMFDCLSDGHLIDVEMEGDYVPPGS